MKAVIPEIITEWNIERMRHLVINGPNKFPGVNYIVRPDGVKIRLDFVRIVPALLEKPWKLDI